MTLPQPEGRSAEVERRRRLIFDMLATRSLRRVLAVLSAADVPCAPVKGIVLGRWLYEQLWQRPFVDVDLLVPRSAFARAAAIVQAHRWPIFYRSNDLGELGFTLDGVPIELHAEVGRRHLSRLTVDDLLARATLDTATFSFAIRRLDDVDHFLLLVLNVIKDGFTYANAHQPEDLERLLRHLGPRQHELVTRATASGLTTALHITASWMENTHASTEFGNLRAQLPPCPRPLFLAAVRLHTRLDRRHPVRLRNVSGVLGLGLATQMADDRRLRLAGLARVAWRGLVRRTGRDPG